MKHMFSNPNCTQGGLGLPTCYSHGVGKAGVYIKIKISLLGLNEIPDLQRKVMFLNPQYSFGAGGMAGVNV